MMNKQREIENLAQNSLTEFARARTCVIGKAATGNVVKWKNEIFVVTCDHVAHDFVNGHLGENILLKNNIKFSYENFSLAAYTKKYDIAVLQCKNRIDTSFYYEIENFNFLEDFSIQDFSETNFFFCGYPGEIVERDEKGIGFKYFTYMTISHKNIPHQNDFLYCEYPVNAFVIDNISGQRRHPPNPKGMSGSFVFQLKKFTGKIWSPDFAEIVAMQIEWDEKSFLKCSNIKFLKEMFDQIG